MKIKWEFSECQLNWVINNFNWGNHLRKWVKCERLLSICCLKPGGFKQQVATRQSISDGRHCEDADTKRSEVKADEAI